MNLEIELRLTEILRRRAAHGRVIHIADAGYFALVPHTITTAKGGLVTSVGMSHLGEEANEAIQMIERCWRIRRDGE